MNRKKRIVVLAHCLLNVNAKIHGLALYSGAMESLVIKYIKEGIGIIQLPCPEMTYLGCQRWGMSKNQYDNPSFRRHCRNIVLPIVEQLEDYQKNGYIIEGIIGVNGSPSCGVSLVTYGYQGGMIDLAEEQKDNLQEANAKGIMIEELSKLLKEHNLEVEFESINEKG